MTLLIQTSMREFRLIDGSNMVFRAYYGLPELNNEEGTNINAVYGFFRMLLRMLQTKPEYLVIARDSPVRTVRAEIFEDYKAQRISMPDNFRRQMNMIKELVAQLHIPAEEIPWFEADDIIFTLVQHAKHHEHSLMFKIISSDKDLKQMLSTNVINFDAMKQKITTYESFKQEFGFVPERIVDYLAIVWDVSDNIPGVQGIGEKWAKELITAHQTLENLYANLETIAPRYQQKLRDGKETAFSSRNLIRLIDIPALAHKGVDAFLYPLDGTHWKRILVDGQGYASLEKLCGEFKLHPHVGQQHSLFW